MPLSQIVLTDGFPNAIDKMNAAIDYIAQVSPSSLEVLDIGGATGVLDGHILRYNGSTGLFQNVPLTGTANQITVTSGTTGISLSTPQNIHTSATPTFGGLTLTGPENLNDAQELRFYNTGSANYVALKGCTGPIAGNVTWRMPWVDGSAGQVLKTDGSGALSFVTATTAPGGSTTQLQYNNAGAFAGATGLVYNNGTNVLTAYGQVSSPLFGSTGAVAVKPGTNAITAFQVQNSSGTYVLNVDTTNSRVGVGATGPYKLDVGGDVNVSTGSAFKVNGTTVLSGSTLGSGITASSLTSVGTLASLTLSGAFTGATGSFTSLAVTGAFTGATGSFTSLNVAGLLQADSFSTASVFAIFDDVVTQGTSASVSVTKVYNITANSVTLTLPASPSTGNKIGFRSASSSIDSYTISRNGENIMGLAEDLTVDRASPLDLLYIGASGWVLA